MRVAEDAERGKGRRGLGCRRGGLKRWRLGGRALGGAPDGIWPLLCCDVSATGGVCAQPADRAAATAAEAKAKRFTSPPTEVCLGVILPGAANRTGGAERSHDVFETVLTGSPGHPPAVREAADFGNLYKHFLLGGVDHQCPGVELQADP